MHDINREKGTTMLKPLCVLLMLAVMIAVPVRAADDKAGAAKTQVRQLQQEKRTLEQDKAQLEQDKAALDGQVREASAAIDAARGKADRSARQSAQLQKELAQARAENADLTGKMNDLQTQLTETQARLLAVVQDKQTLEGTRTQLQTYVSERDKALSSCITKNQQEYENAQNILEKYQHKSCLGAMLQREPFIGIGKTQLENEVAGYREQLDRDHIVPPAPTGIIPAGFAAKTE